MQKLLQPAQHLVPRSVVPRLGLQPLRTCMPWFWVWQAWSCTACVQSLGIGAQPLGCMQDLGLAMWAG